MWQLGTVSKSDAIKVLKPVESIEGIPPGNLRLIELSGPEERVEYIFQGEFDLGYGEGEYNLTVYSESPTSQIIQHVGTITGTTVESKGKRKGQELARKLVRTIPEEIYQQMGFKRSLEWLILAWSL